MAKGQKRSNREIRKPKQDQAASNAAPGPRNHFGLSAIKDVKRVDGKAHSPNVQPNRNV